MKNIGTILLITMMIASIAEARYVRQVREPDFFIPANDRMHKAEKLPKIKIIKPIQKPVKTVEVKTTETKKEVYTTVPEYKNKYGKYVANLAVFAKSKIMPEDKELEEDLKVFNEGEIFEVTQEAPQKITSAEQRAFYDIANEILKN